MARVAENIVIALMALCLLVAIYNVVNWVKP